MDVEKKQKVFGYILYLGNLLQQWGDKITPEITLKQWFQLNLISKMEGDISLQQIAEFSGTTRQNTRKLVDQLENKGFLRIEPSQEDKRRVEVTLTDKSKDFFKEHEQLGNEKLEDIFHGISLKDISTCLQVLECMIHNLEEQ